MRNFNSGYMRHLLDNLTYDIVTQKKSRPKIKTVPQTFPEIKRHSVTSLKISI